MFGCWYLDACVAQGAKHIEMPGCALRMPDMIPEKARVAGTWHVKSSQSQISSHRRNDQLRQACDILTHHNCHPHSLPRSFRCLIRRDHVTLCSLHSGLGRGILHPWLESTYWKVVS